MQSKKDNVVVCRFLRELFGNIILMHFSSPQKKYFFLRCPILHQNDVAENLAHKTCKRPHDSSCFAYLFFRAFVVHVGPKSADLFASVEAMDSFLVCFVYLGSREDKTRTTDIDGMADGEMRRYMVQSRWTGRENASEKLYELDVHGVGLTMGGVRRVLSELTPVDGDTWDTPIRVWFEDNRGFAPAGCTCTYTGARAMFLRWLGMLIERGDVICDEIGALVGLMTMQSEDL